MAWRVMENEPEISACDAMIAAAVESVTSGSKAHDGASRKNGCSDGGIDQQQRALTQVVQDQGGQHEGKPRESDRLFSEVAHVSVERLAPRDHQEHGTEYRESGEAVDRRRRSPRAAGRTLQERPALARSRRRPGRRS